MNDSFDQQKKKIILVAGIITFTYLLILSQIFFMERTCFVDMSFILFQIAREHTLQIQVNRFGSAVTQIFPLTGVWLGLSLEAIARLYSASFVIWYFTVFLICAVVLKKYSHALMVLLFATLMVADTFYWLTNELLQGMAFCILFFAFIEWLQEGNKNKYFLYASIVTGSFVAAFFHPLVVIAFFFYIIFRFINNRNGIWVFSGISFAVFYTVKIIFYSRENTYDHGAFSAIQNTPGNISHLFELISTQNFFEYLTVHYSVWLIAFVGCSVFFLLRKQWLNLILFTSATIGFFVVINTAFPDCKAQFYIESHYQVMSFFVAVCLSLSFFTYLKNAKLFVLILGLILISRMIDITLDHKKWTARLSWMENFLQKTESLPSKKIMMKDEQAPLDTLILTWGTGTESWLISTLKDRTESRSFLIDYSWENVENYLNSTHKVLTKFGVYPYDSLDKKYFHFNDTSQYVWFEKSMLDSTK